MTEKRDDDSLGLDVLARVVWRSKARWIFGGFTFSCLAVVYSFLGVSSEYVSRAEVELGGQEEQIVDLQSVVSGLGRDLATVNTEMRVIKSRRLLEKLVLDLNLIGDPEFNPKLDPPPKVDFGPLMDTVRRFLTSTDSNEQPSLQEGRTELDTAVDLAREKVFVSNDSQSFVVIITARTEGRAKSTLLANKLADIYIDNQLEVKFEATQKANRWLSDRVVELEAQLALSESELEEFSATSDTASPEIIEGLNFRASDLRNRIQDQVAIRDRYLSELADISLALQSGDWKSLLEFEKIGRGIAQSQIGSSEATIEQIYRSANELKEEIAEDLRKLEQLLLTLETASDQLKAQLASITENQIRMRQLQREAAANRTLYQSFLSRLKETSIQQGILQADARVLSYAVDAVGPISPKRRIYAVLSFIFGAGVILFLSIYREITASCFRTGSDVRETTGLPFLGEMPEVPFPRRSSVFRYLKENPTSVAAEALRNLRTSAFPDIHIQPEENDGAVIMVTSTVPGEGKSTLSMCLGQSVAALHKKTIVIDADLRRKATTNLLSGSQKPGLFEVLNEKMPWTDAVLTHDDFDCHFLPAGTGKGNPADLFSAANFSILLAEIKKDYDYILLDTPPILVVPDAKIIAQSADSAIYCIRWNEISTEQVQLGVRSLSENSVTVLGSILSRVNLRDLKKYGIREQYGGYSVYGRGKSKYYG